MKRTIRLISVLLMLAMVLALLPVSAFAAKENIVVYSVAITDIDAPVAGKAPDTTATSDRSDCSITHVGWMEYSANGSMVGEMEAGDTFRHGYMYAVVVTVTITSNRKFSSPTCTINGGSTELVLTQDQELIAMYTFAPLPQAISSVALTVVAPADGKTPTFAKISTTEYESKNYTEKISNQSNGCVWTNTATSVNLSVNNPFKAGNTYSVGYTLFPKDGYTFTSSTTATINGKKAVVELKNGFLFVVLSGLKPSTKTVNPVTITNVTAPAVGKTPSYSIKATGTGFAVNGQNSDYWTNGVGWVEYEPGQSSGKMMKKNATFKAGYRYAIVVDLAVTESGYYFVKDESTATVNGKSATLNPDSLTARVIYTFPALEALKISSVSISVTAPAAGAKPTFNKIDGDGFYSDNGSNSAAAYKNGIAWFKSSSSYITSGTTETFEAGKSYTLKIGLKAKENYAFASNVAATINGKKATVTVLDADNILLEIALSTPKAEHTHTPSKWMSDDLGHWKECTDSTCSALVSQVEMHLNTDEDGKCDTCGYQLPIEVPDEDPVDPPVDDPVDPPVDDPVDPPVDDPVDPPVDDPVDPPVEEPSEDETPSTQAPTTKDDEVKDTQDKDDQDEGDEKGNNNSWLVWVLAGVALAAIVACVILLVVKKKK